MNQENNKLAQEQVSAPPMYNLNREPWVAVLYSQFVPGLGQWYAGKTKNAVLYFIFAVGFFSAGLWFLFSPGGSFFAAIACFILGFAVNIGNLFDAYDAATATNGKPGEAFRKQTKDPWLAVFLSLIIPGIGHFYNRRIVLGILFLVIGAAAGVLENITKGSEPLHFFAGLFYASLAFGACIHALHSCPGIRTERTHIKKTVLLILALTLLRGPVLSATVKQFFVRAYVIPTNSMKPTIVSGDRFFAFRGIFRSPQRGDIVAFMPAANISDNNIPFLKRVIAVQGDVVTIASGNNILVNGVLITRNQGAELDLNTLKSIEKTQNSIAQNDYDILIGKNEIFVVGDNLISSYDSRNFGPVPISSVRGYIYKVFWPPDHAGQL